MGEEEEEGGEKGGRRGSGEFELFFFEGTAEEGGWFLRRFRLENQYPPPAGRQAGQPTPLCDLASETSNDFSPDLSQQILGVAVFEYFEGWEKWSSNILVSMIRVFKGSDNLKFFI